MESSGSHGSKPDLPKTLITESGAASAANELLSVNQIISDRYKVISIIGHGGMGAVYKVEQIFLRRLFALKTLHGHDFTEVAIRRFHKEAQAASKLNHPNLVKAHDFGVLENHQPFFVMDLVEGQNLSQYSRRVGILPIEEVLNIFIPVCFGLNYAHEQGVIHRDIKPGNIMLAVSPKEPGGYIPKVVDFGIAKMSESEDAHSMTLTRTGEVFGTPLYMSPEQCTGIKVDHRSDIYSLGCVMYEALTGAPPFHGDTALNLMMKHQSAMPASLKEASMGREFPSTLEAIVAKTLIKDPNNRYQSFLDLALDLANFKQSLSASSIDKKVGNAYSRTVKDIPALSSPQVKEKKTMAPYAAAVACTLCLLSGMALGWLLAGKQPAEIPKSQEAPLSEAARRDYEEALNAGNTRYLTIENAHSEPVQVYKFPSSFDVGVFKYIHPSVKGDNSVAAQGEIKVPLQAETYLKVSAGRLFSYPHLLKGFQAGDLHHLHITNDSSEKVEDVAFVFDTSLAQVAQIRGLKEIFLFGTATTDKGISFIKDLPVLDSIDFSDTKITAAAIRALKNFPEMRIIGLKGVAGAKSLVPHLVPSKRLEILNLAKTGLNDADMSQLSKIENLRYLTVDSNPEVTNEGIRQFKNLIALNIAATGITPAVKETLKKMPNLRLLTISKENWPAGEVQKLVNELPNVTVETQKLDSNKRLTNWIWQRDL